MWLVLTILSNRNLFIYFIVKKLSPTPNKYSGLGHAAQGQTDYFIIYPVEWGNAKKEVESFEEIQQNGLKSTKI